MHPSLSYPSIASTLIALRDYDLEVRELLILTGELFKGYHPEMEKVHIANARELGTIINEIGWPTKQKVGSDAHAAAMMIAQHAISLPEFQRRCLKLIEDSIVTGEESKRSYAFLYDRICYNERRPQKFGTQYDWDQNGIMSPWTLEDPEHVNERRLEHGLNPIEEETAAIRLGVIENGETPPADYGKRQKEIEEWCRKTGWI